MAEAAVRTQTPPLQQLARFLRRYAALSALIVLLAFNLAFTPHFLSWQTLNVNLTQVATIVIVSVGIDGVPAC